MANQLKNIVRFVGLVLGVPVSLPHNLNVNGVAQTPDKVEPNIGGFTVTADATNVTVTRVNSETAVDVYVEFWHSENRVFGASGAFQPTGLTPRPFVLALSPPNGFDPGRTIVVAKSGGDVTSIAAGLIAVAALVPPPSVANPAMVWVFPGVYSEVPMALVPFTALTAVNGESVTIIEALTATSPLITGAANSEICGFTLRGANGVGGVGLRHTTTRLVARNMVVENCTTAFEASGAAADLLLVSTIVTRALGETLDTAYIANAGGSLAATVARASGVAGALISVGFCARDAGSQTNLQATTATLCVDGVRTDGTAELSAVSGIIDQCTNGLRIGPTSGVLRIDNMRVTNSTTWDLLIEAAAATFSGNANTLRNDRLNFAAGSSILSQHASEFTDSTSISIFGELNVGSETNPTESAFGGGEPHVRNMAVFRNTNLEIGVFSDITTEMASPTGSTADAFPGTGAGNTLFIGGDVAFPNNKLFITAAIALGGAGALIWEFSNGAGWTAMNVMTSDALPPFDQFAQDVFGRINTEQLRFGPMVGWATQAVDGTTKFWVRVRVAVAITTVPTLEQINLGPDRSEINQDGTMGFFGAAEVERNVTMHQRLMDALGGATPVNGALALSTNITITPVRNRFNNNVQDGLGALFEMPLGIDTSQPFTVEVDWIPKTTPGNVELEVNFAEVKIGDTLDGTLADTNVAIVVAAPAIDVLVHTELEFSVPELVPGDLIAFSLFRDARGSNPDDTLAGSIDLVTVSLVGMFWKS